MEDPFKKRLRKTRREAPLVRNPPSANSTTWQNPQKTYLRPSILYCYNFNTTPSLFKKTTDRFKSCEKIESKG